LEHQLAAAEEKENLARLSGSPNLGIGLDYVIIGKRNNVEVEDNGKNAFMPMITLSLPIYRQKYKAYREEALFQQEALKNARQNMINNLNSSYSDALWELQKSENEIELYTQQIDQADQAYRLLARSYAAAGEEFEEMLRMIRQKLSYQLALVDARKRFSSITAKIEWFTAK
jgi:outer membrane protein TolC